MGCGPIDYYQPGYPAMNGCGIEYVVVWYPHRDAPLLTPTYERKNPEQAYIWALTLGTGLGQIFRSNKHDIHSWARPRPANEDSHVA